MRNKSLPRSCSAAQIETLEDRRLLSAAYNAMNLARAIPTASQTGLNGIEITNGGLILLNGQQSFVYSLSGHHLYPAPTGFTINAVNNQGDDVRTENSGAGEVIVDYQGHSQSVALISTEDETQLFSPISMNAAGEVAGDLVDNYHPVNTFGQSGVITSTWIVAADGSKVASQGSTNGTAAPRAALNDAGTLAFNLANNSAARDAEVYHGDTQTTTDIGAMFRSGTATEATGINASGVVVGTYSRGRSVAGIFVFDSATDTLHTIPTPVGEQASFVTISDNGTIVGTVNEVLRLRSRTRAVSRAALFSASAGVQDLSAMAAIPAGATLTAANSVNDSGDILVQCVLATGNSIPFLLTPAST